jgi:hypothetical protein
MLRARGRVGCAGARGRMGRRGGRACGCGSLAPRAARAGPPPHARLNSSRRVTKAGDAAGSVYAITTTWAQIAAYTAPSCARRQAPTAPPATPAPTAPAPPAAPPQPACACGGTSCAASPGCHAARAGLAAGRTAATSSPPRIAARAPPLPLWASALLLEAAGMGCCGVQVLPGAWTLVKGSPRVSGAVKIAAFLRGPYGVLVSVDRPQRTACGRAPVAGRRRARGAAPPPGAPRSWRRTDAAAHQKWRKRLPSPLLMPTAAATSACSLR